MVWLVRSYTMKRSNMERSEPELVGVAGSTKQPRWTGANGVDALAGPPPRPRFLSIARSCRPPGHQQHNTSYQHTKIMPSHAARRVKTHTGAHPADTHTHFTHCEKGHLQLHPSQKRYGPPYIFFHAAATIYIRRPQKWGQTPAT